MDAGSGSGASCATGLGLAIPSRVAQVGGHRACRCKYSLHTCSASVLAFEGRRRAQSPTCHTCCHMRGGNWSSAAVLLSSIYTQHTNLFGRSLSCKQTGLAFPYCVITCSVNITCCRWLLSKGRQEEGREALRKVLNADEAAKEAADITAQIERDRQARIGWWQAVRTPELHAQLSIG